MNPSIALPSASTGVTNKLMENSKSLKNRWNFFLIFYHFNMKWFRWIDLAYEPTIHFVDVGDICAHGDRKCCIIFSSFHTNVDVLSSYTMAMGQVNLHEPVGFSKNRLCIYALRWQLMAIVFCTMVSCRAKFNFSLNGTEFWTEC